jgi:indolepyruvate ferredoxin oxidoreductase alpha subunit
MNVWEAAESPVRDLSRIVLPPANFAHEIEKIEHRWPAAVSFVKEQKLNEQFGVPGGEVGIIVQGGLFNTLNRVLEVAGLSDAYGNSKVPIYVLNVTYPLVPDEVRDFCAGKRAVLVVEEGQPEFIEHELSSLLRRADLQTRLVGKEILPRAGEYSGAILGEGVSRFLREFAEGIALTDAVPAAPLPITPEQVPQRPAGLCTGCPERPIFSAMKLVQRELGQFHVSADIGCHLFSILPPFHIGNTTMGYGLGTAGASAFKARDRRAIAVMGDGGFWHNGLTSGIGNAVFNQDDTVTVIVDNGYSAATGGQDLLSSRGSNSVRRTKHPIESAVRGIGASWVRTLTRTYDVAKVRETLREALTSKDKGPKVIIAQSECQLNRQRRVRPAMKKAIEGGQRVVRERFGVDPDTCTGDHSCIRLSGCPSLTIKPNPDPLREDPVTSVDNSCVGCGVCGEVSHAAVLCPSFYKAQIVYNPTRWDQFRDRSRNWLLGLLQRRGERALAKRAF